MNRMNISSDYTLPCMNANTVRHREYKGLFSEIQFIARVKNWKHDDTLVRASIDTSAEYTAFQKPLQTAVCLFVAEHAHVFTMIVYFATCLTYLIAVRYKYSLTLEIAVAPLLKGLRTASTLFFFFST